MPELIEYARDAFRRENLNGRFQVADIRQIDFENRFDLCLMLSGTFGFPTPEEDASLLSRIHRALRSGGKAFIDYLPIETYSKVAHSRTWHQIEGGFALVEEWYHVPTSTWRTRHWHIFLDGRLIEAADEDGHGANEIIRCYSAPEIEALAAKVGFHVRHHVCRKHIGKIDYRPTDEDPRGIIVLEKVN